MEKDALRRLADLARIGLGEEILLSLEHEFTPVLSYVDQIRLLDTEGSDHELIIKNITQPDDAPAPFSRELLLQNMPEREGDYLKVKKIL